VASGVVVSQEITAPRTEVWRALVHTSDPSLAAAETVQHGQIGLGSTVLDLDVVDPVDGVTGTAVWAGLAHRVTAHLVDLGADTTLLVLTADEERQGAASPLLGSGRTALAHRHVQRDLRQVADDVGRACVRVGVRG
jgi:hypothetical protein